MRWLALLWMIVGCSSAPVVEVDAGTMDGGRLAVDAGRDALVVVSDAGQDAGHDAGPSIAETCAVESLIDAYSSILPPNPYGSFPSAGACAAPHDVIILLGCPSEDDGAPSSCQTERADLAIELMRAGYGDRFIVTGAAVHNDHVEADALRDLLVARGIDESAIALDRLAQHTDENLYYSSRIMMERGWRTALVVSDDPGHLVFSAVCDANCCVELGRLTVLSFPVDGDDRTVGHYVLFPHARAVTTAECDHVKLITRAMCVNLGSRRACADDFMLPAP